MKTAFSCQQSAISLKVEKDFNIQCLLHYYKADTAKKLAAHSS